MTIVCVDQLHLNCCYLFVISWTGPVTSIVCIGLLSVSPFFGFLRAGELSVTPTASRSDCLQLSDLSLSSFPFPHLLRLLIKVSKSDPFRDTCTVVVGRNDSALCPVEALLKYLHFRGGRPGPLFIFPDGSPLTRDLLNSKIRNLLVSCGVVADYTGHCFRIGAATTAARVGLPDHLIKTLGRWFSDAYKLYIRTSELDIAAVSSKLLNQHVAALHIGVEWFLSVFFYVASG